MNPLWLLAIIPASAFIGFVGCAILTAAKRADTQARRYVPIERGKVLLLRHPSKWPLRIWRGDGSSI